MTSPCPPRRSSDLWRDDLATETVDVDRPFEALAFRLNDRRDRCWSHTRRALRCQNHDDRGGERSYRSNVFDPRGLPGCAVLSKWDLGAAPRPPSAACIAKLSRPGWLPRGGFLQFGVVVTTTGPGAEARGQRGQARTEETN